MLASLTSEILGLILSYPTVSPQILRLWKSGDSVLRAKLLTYVTEVDLRCELFVSQTVPRLLLQLPYLRRISLTTKGMLMKSPTDWEPLLQQLPQTLETLEIRAWDAHFALLACAAGSTLQAQRYTKTAYPRGQSSYRDLGALFPNLTKLLIDASYFIAMTEETMRLHSYFSTPGYGNDFVGLPSTLTSFALRPEPKTSPLFSTLPRNITALDMHIYVHNLDNWGTQDFRDAPPQLAYIQFLRLQGCPESLDFLPSSLTHAPGLLATVPTQNWTWTRAKSIPSLLRMLDVYTNTIDVNSFGPSGELWTSAFPCFLTKLVFTRTQNLSLSIDLIASLPRTLTKIKAPSARLFDWDSIIEDTSTLDYWPPHLRDLCFAPTKLVQYTLACLPPTLRKLRLKDSSVRALDMELTPSGARLLYVSELPPTLTALHWIIGTRRPSAIAFDEVLPPSITKLIVQQTRLERETLETALPDSITDLDVQLEELKHYGDPSTHPHLEGEVFKLPSTLKTLRVDTWRCDWLSSLPRSLRSLEVTLILGVTSNENGDPFTGLPPSLTRLMFASAPIPALLNNGQLPTAPHLLSTLPTTLRFLYFGLLIALFPSAAIRTLPRSLVSVTLDMEPISEADAPHLPSLLTYANFGHRNTGKEVELAAYWPVKSLFSARGQPAFHDRLHALYQ